MRTSDDVVRLDHFLLECPDMPVSFPHRYSASLSRTSASRAKMESPDGDPQTWSPQHMLLSSLSLCMLTTFEGFAARDGIEIVSWDAEASGTVERTPEGLMFTSIVLELDIAIAGNVDRIDATLEDAKQDCLVLNSLRIPVVIEAQVHTPGDTEDDDDDAATHPPQLPPLHRRQAEQHHSA